MYPGPKTGVRVVRGLATGRDSLTDSPVPGASQRIADCSASAGGRAKSADRVIKPNAQIFNTGTGAGGAWRGSTVSAPQELELEPERREHCVGPVVGGGLVDADRDLPQGAVLAVAHDGDVAGVGPDLSRIGIAAGAGTGIVTGLVGTAII